MTIPGRAEQWEQRVQLAAHPVAYPLLRAASRMGPVIRLPRVGVLVSTKELARTVLMDSETFTKTGPGSPADLWTPVVGPTALLNMEGAAHLELRRKLGPLFSPTAVTTLCAGLGPSVLAEPLTGLSGFEALDLVRLAGSIAGAAICTLVGLPADPQLFERSLAAASGITADIRLGRRGLTSAQESAARTALAGLTDPAREAWRSGDGRTVPGRMRELGLTEQEAIGAVAAFVLVGTETLISFLPRLVALLIDAGWWSRLLADPALRPAVIAEALRFTVPSPVMLRSVARPGRVGRVAVTPGDRVVIATALAARVQRHFDPSTTAAADLRQLWFGAGSHFCLGMPLAMAQINLMLDALLAVGELQVIRRKVQRHQLIPSYRSLVVARA